LGGVILLFILVVLVGILLTPAMRARLGKQAPPPADDPSTPPHEVVVHKLDDHRNSKSASDDAKKS
jgi:hypothetical protein